MNFCYGNSRLKQKEIYIPAKIAPNKSVAIYCRVSTNHDSSLFGV